MVRILSTGEIVPDSDPRASQATNRQPNQGMGRIQHDGDVPQRQYQQVSAFDALNEKLLGYGIPRFNIGAHTVEPIVLVGFVLAGLFMGLPGLLLAAVLFIVSKMSSTGGGLASFLGGAGPGQATANQRTNREPRSEGHRLGNS